MNNRGQPPSAYRARRQRGNRHHAGSGQQNSSPVVPTDDVDQDVIDGGVIHRYRESLERALQRHASAGHNGPLFLDPADPGSRSFYLRD